MESIWIHHYDKLIRLDEALLGSSLDLQGSTLMCRPNSISETIDDESIEMLTPTTLSLMNNVNITTPELSTCCPSPSFVALDQLPAIVGVDSTDEGLSAIFSSSKVTRRLCDSVTISSVESDTDRLVCNNSSEILSGAKRKLEDYEKTGGRYHISFSKNDQGARKLQRASKSSPTPVVPRSINFSQESCYEIDTEAIAQVKEMIYRAAALRPITSIGMEEGGDQKPKRKNVRISSDPQTVAARHRRERISERLRILQKIVPGGSKMDTATMLDEAANYLKFLKSQIKALEVIGCNQVFPMHTCRN